MPGKVKKVSAMLKATHARDGTGKSPKRPLALPDTRALASLIITQKRHQPPVLPAAAFVTNICNSKKLGTS
jgi:hypothetical protein